jgi:hypothetical protein
MNESKKYKCPPDCKQRGGYILVQETNIGTCTQGKRFILISEGQSPEFESGGAQSCPKSNIKRFPAIPIE